MAASFRPNGRNIDALTKGANADVGKELARRAIKVEAGAKRLCPVDTGRLRSSITWRADSDAQGISVVIGTNVEYAVYVEVGTSTQAARPYLRPALQAGAR